MFLANCLAILCCLTPQLALSNANLLFADMNLWYALPLIVSVSLVCAATRHEQITPIIAHAMRFGLWIVVFMGGVMLLLSFMDWMA